MHNPRKKQLDTAKMLQQASRKQKTVALVAIVAAFAVLGGVFVVASHADSFAKGVEAEDGQVGGNAKKVADASASGGNKVTFSNVAAGGGGTGTIVPGADGPADASKCAQTASAKFNWGEPQYSSYFNTPTLDPTWHPYGPEPGHQDKGERTPATVIMNGDGTVSLKSDGQGSTAAMSWYPGQLYGRWEVCYKVQTGDQHYVALTWPDAENWPEGGELDFSEESGGPTKQSFFLHCAAGGNCNVGSTNADMRQYHAFALEWTPNATIGYVDGNQFFKADNDGQIKYQHHLCLQLDFFEDHKTGPDAMIVDWTKQWPVAQSKPSTLGLKPGEGATGVGVSGKTPRPLSVSEMRP